MIEKALWYSEKMHFSIIPVKKNKKSFVKWADYQTVKPSRQQLKEWWAKWPNANIGIVTGAVSGIDVVDCDSIDGKNALNEYLSDTFLTPVVKTPKGWHYYFRHKPGLANGVRILRDCDLRTTGGYIIAPPSMNGEGLHYEWEEGLKIFKTPFQEMPSMLFDILSSSPALNATSGPAPAYKNDSIPLVYNKDFKKGGVLGGGVCGDEKTECNKAQQSAAMRNISFSKPGRDDALFHLANYLVKGGMPAVNIEKYLYFIGQNCNPPFPESEIKLKVQSALDRTKKRNAGVKNEIFELISVTSGVISVTNIYQAVTSVTKEEKAAVRKAVQRLVEEGLLEKSSTRAGEYRIIDKTCKPENWKEANVENVKLWLPFELNEMIEIPAGSIILFAGAQDAGKSAVMMNIAKENMEKWNVHYFSSELSAASFKNRLSKFDNMYLEDWNINFYSRGHGFSDVIKNDANDLNIIDYLEIHDQFYKVAEFFDAIYRKMNGKGVTVVAIQKDPHKEFGRGGSFIEEKPVLSIALDKGGVAKINKFKGEWWGDNPRGMQYQYKIINGSRLKMVKHWHTPLPNGAKHND